MGTPRRRHTAARIRTVHAALVLTGSLLVAVPAAQDRATQDRATQDRPVEQVATDAPSAVESGPQPGPMPALTCAQPAGPGAGAELDVATLFQEGSGAVLFVHELTRNVAPVVRSLDQLADTHAPLGFDSVTILLAADRNAAERQAVAASRSITLTRPLTVSVNGAEGPGAWALNRRASLTLVTVRDGQVVASLGLTDTGARDVRRVQAMIEAVTGGALPEDPAALRRLALERLPQDPEVLRARAARNALLLHWQAKMRVEQNRRTAQRRNRPQPAPGMRERSARDGDRAEADGGRGDRDQPRGERVGAPPDDEPLRGLLRRAIRKTAEAQELDTVFEAIDARVEAVPDTESQAVEMFRLMLSLDYGNEEARRRAARWVEAHGGEVPGKTENGGDRRRDGEAPAPTRRDGRGR